ncbi:ATP phosphoribosyltransferase [Saccharothrix coeruleofusca]|uniref:ATP phosphoribosyltransferase n=1 Tax=Saccharothrix coeruleofusca TaxID=33919 RepID=A0A918EI61_9PSEU|nr:ATP phosphoribosyltransferase [Saccharothrix coeruleofusca]MBP2336923.1 ATP phosphoribosyltransferase [Saccharothrix coeruleofusca]GGP81882.1 ATP phosphoribosyltransferase [Saccharothrix coeruleofusca]
MAALRFALPNKGSLSAPAAQMLAEAGYRVNRSGRELIVADPANDVQFFFLRPRDIAVYVGEGSLDVGITGRDLLRDSTVSAKEILSLGFGRAAFYFAGKPGGISDAAGLAGKRIATSYPKLVQEHLAELGIEAHLVRLDGAVETAVELGVADAIADVVETGTTLRTSGLQTFGDPILKSEAVLIQGEQVADTQQTVDAVEVLTRRLQGVLIARRYVILDFDCPVAAQEEAFKLVPGIEAPTVSPLAREGWVAVRSLVPRDHAPRVMDELWRVGARAILVSSLDTCRI